MLLLNEAKTYFFAFSAILSNSGMVFSLKKYLVKKEKKTDEGLSSLFAVADLYYIIIF